MDFPAEPLNVVETSNFREVLKQFDGEGNIINRQTTRFHIDCEICQQFQLLILDETHVGQPVADTHETYAVLPRCGHAFGYDCIKKWISISSESGPRGSTCPACRTPIGCRRCGDDHLPPYAYGNGWTRQEDDIAVRIWWQEDDIEAIRKTLREEEDLCEECLFSDEQSARSSSPDSDASEISPGTYEWDLLYDFREGIVTSHDDRDAPVTVDDDDGDAPGTVDDDYYDNANVGIGFWRRHEAQAAGRLAEDAMSDTAITAERIDLVDPIIGRRIHAAMDRLYRRAMTAMTTSVGRQASQQVQVQQDMPLPPGADDAGTDGDEDGSSE
ncbi:hypothetical protein GGR56DRAFT_657447 [Xylariaceae sp. FL0804]|nr:hypothetical protein GGR56DRAFT_657447 [Xylariaceae sp. FL0804]